MFHPFTATSPREQARWLVFAFMLLAPGSLFILVPLWLGRYCALRAARPKTLPRPEAAGAPADVPSYREIADAPGNIA